MKRAREAEAFRREPGGLARVICGDALPHTGEALPAGPGPAAPARRGPRVGPYDEIDVEFYLDCIGGE
jgi:hypothetical protein